MPKKAIFLIILILSLFFINLAYFVLALEERPILDIVLLFDHSYSMFEYNDGRMYEAQIAANDFIGHLDPVYDKVALIRFSDYAEINKYLGTPFIEIKKKIDSFHPDYFSKFSNLQKAIAKAVGELTSERARSDAQKLIILLSDGEINRPKLNGQEDTGYAHALAIQEAESAKNKNITIHTVLVGNSNIDRELLATIAARTGGNNYIATSPIDLIPVFEHIASTLTTDTTKPLNETLTYIGYKDGTRIPHLQTISNIDEMESENPIQETKLLEPYFSNYFFTAILVLAILAGAYFGWLFGKTRKEYI